MTGAELILGICAPYPPMFLSMASGIKLLWKLMKRVLKLQAVTSVEMKVESVRETFNMIVDRPFFLAIRSSEARDKT